MSTIFFAPPMPHPPAPVNKGWRIGLMIALGVLTLAPYAQTAWFGFVRYDDGVYVYENDVVRQGLTFDGLRYAFTSSVNGTWLPLAMLSHMLDCQLYGLRSLPSLLSPPVAPPYPPSMRSTSSPAPPYIILHPLFPARKSLPNPP